MSTAAQEYNGIDIDIAVYAKPDCNPLLLMALIKSFENKPLNPRILGPLNSQDYTNFFGEDPYLLITPLCLIYDHSEFKSYRILYLTYIDKLIPIALAFRAAAQR